MNASADNVVSPAVAEVNSLVEKGLRALDEFLKLDQEQIDFIETFAKKPFPRWPKSKHRFSSNSAPNYS